MDGYGVRPLFDNEALSRLQAVAPDGLPVLEWAPGRLPDKSLIRMPRLVVFQNSTAVGRIETPRPTVFDGDWIADPSWLVDVLVDDTRFPVREPVIGLLADQADHSMQGYGVRPSCGGITYTSDATAGLPGTLGELPLARPKIRVPDGLEIFQSILESKSLSAEVSDKGRYTRACLELWGGLTALVADLADKSVLALLNGFKSTSPSEIEPGCFCNRRRYLMFKNVCELTEKKPPIRGAGWIALLHSESYRVA